MKKKLPQGITHRKDGRYMWRFQHEGVSYSGYCAHLKDAEIAMYHKKYEVYNHLCERMTTPTMNQWFLEWMTTYKKNCKAVTAYSYWKAYKNYIADELGNYRLDQIPAKELQETINDLSDHYSPTVINTSRVLLYGMLEQARKNAMIEFNPMKNISRPKTQEKPKKQVLTAEEELIFLNAALPSFYYPLYKLATLTGMRIGEITALRWNDIDMENRLIHVRHTLDYTAEKGLFLETPKTKSSKRDIPMISAAAELLTEHRKEQKRLLHEAAMKMSTPVPPSVFLPFLPITESRTVRKSSRILYLQAPAANRSIRPVSRRTCPKSSLLFLQIIASVTLSRSIRYVIASRRAALKTA